MRTEEELEHPCVCRQPGNRASDPGHFWDDATPISPHFRLCCRGPWCFLLAACRAVLWFPPGPVHLRVLTMPQTPGHPEHSCAWR